jgi:hypothetical protein
MLHKLMIVFTAAVAIGIATFPTKPPLNGAVVAGTVADGGGA